jgi:glycosyltransferase involved in cell wall biosynthesis
MNSKATISIVIPFYNTPIKYFSKMLASLEKLDVNEIILVDDCSSDKAVVKLAKQSGHVYLKTLHQSGHDGLPFELGIKAAKSDYIMRVDSDDELLFIPEYKEADMTLSRMDRVALSGNLTVEELILAPRSLVGTIIRREIMLDLLPQHDKFVFNDVLLVLRILNRKHTFRVSPKVNYLYTKRDNSIQSSLSNSQHRLRHIQTVSRFCQLENIPHQQAENYLKLAMKNFRQGAAALKKYQQPQTTMLLMFDGTLPTAFILYELLIQTDQKVHVHYLSMRSDQDRLWRSQDQAVERLLKLFQEYGTFTTSSALIDLEQLSFDSRSDTILLMASKIAPNLKSHVVPLLGWTDDKSDLISKKQDINELWKVLCESMYGEFETYMSKEVAFPLLDRKIDKKSMLKKLPQKLHPYIGQRP